MNNEVAKRYLKDMSMHIININCALKNIKSNVIADFICVDDKGIIITTNNVANVKIVNGGLYFIFPFHFILLLLFYF